MTLSPQRPLCRFAEAPIEARAALRDIIASCLKAQGVGQDMPESLAVDSVIELIEAGFARVESWDDEAGEKRFHIAILTDAGWQ